MESHQHFHRLSGCQCCHVMLSFPSWITMSCYRTRRPRTVLCWWHPVYLTGHLTQSDVAPCPPYLRLGSCLVSTHSVDNSVSTRHSVMLTGQGKLETGCSSMHWLGHRLICSQHLSTHCLTLTQASDYLALSCADGRLEASCGPPPPSPPHQPHTCSFAGLMSPGSDAHSCPFLCVWNCSEWLFW